MELTWRAATSGNRSHLPALHAVPNIPRQTISPVVAEFRLTRSRPKKTAFKGGIFQPNPAIFERGSPTNTELVDLFVQVRYHTGPAAILH